MIRVRKQIEWLEHLCSIAVHLQLTEISCEGCGIARDIDYFLGAEARHLINDVSGATPRWVEDYYIATRARAQQVTQPCANRCADETSMSETSPHGIRLRVSYRGAILFDANEFSCPTRERKTEIPCTAVQFDHSLFLLYIAQVEQRSNEQLIASEVHLGKYSLTH